MKKLFIITLIISLGLFLQCYEDEYETFHLVYSITSVDENQANIDITYKDDKEYVFEQIQTPFIYEQDVKLNKTDKETFYYYLELISTSDKNISIYVTCNDEYKTRIDNLENSYLPLPIYARGYIGFGLVSVTY